MSSRSSPLFPSPSGWAQLVLGTRPRCLLRGDKAALCFSRGESNECTFTSTELLTRIKRSLYPGLCGYSDTTVPGGLRDLAGTNKSS